MQQCACPSALDTVRMVHFACVCVCSVVSDCNLLDLLCPGNFPGKNTKSVLQFPPPGDFLIPGVEPESLASSALAGRFFIIVLPGKPLYFYHNKNKLFRPDVLSL